MSVHRSKGRMLFRAGLAAALAGTFLLAGHVVSAQRQSGRAAAPSPAAAARASAGLTAFRSDEELREFLRGLRRQRGRAGQPGVTAGALAADASPAEGFVSVTANSRTSSPSITNNQEANVDEGGIVKVRGDTLVILRRGRLFTVSLAGGGMRPIDSINAFPPGVSGRGRLV